MKRLSGIAAADGIAIGRAFITDRRRIKTPKRHIAADEVDQEVRRFEMALDETDQQLQRIKEKLYREHGQEHTLILQAHQLILKDEQLVEQTKAFIASEKINAEWALRRTISGIKRLFDQVENDYFRERRSDVDFVADHLMVTLTGNRREQEGPPPDSIVVAHDLSPADTARIYKIGVRAFITEVGGRTAHTSIVARSLGIPAVVGVSEISDVVGGDDLLIVDGYRGEVIHDPDEETVRRYQRRAARRAKLARGLRRERELPAETKDGVRVHLQANIELSDEIPAALAHGAEGIGLYRTEFLYLGRDDYPDEDEHATDALQVLKYSRGNPVTFRTCDLGADKLPGALAGSKELNPSLGLRSIRLCLERSEMFRSQLRGLLRASSEGPLRIMFPMVTGVEVFRQAKALLEECRQELVQEGVEVAPVPLGVMMEMPSAAVTADLLAREVDFFSIGTNDLTQYALGIDRVNEHVNHLFQPCHPAILRLIQHIIGAAEATNIPVTVCGEMAGDPVMTLVLLGMGVRRLSMSALAVPTVKRIIRGATASMAAGLAERVLALSTPSEVEEEVAGAMRQLYPEQWLDVSEDLDEDTIV
jgi:phosphotransferase system enzyme I (PtsI)